MSQCPCASASAFSSLNSRRLPLLPREAYALRPQRTSESTVFYLLFAAGGALGSFLVGIAFPFLFSFNYDLAITFFFTALLALAAVARRLGNCACSGPSPAS